MNLVTQFKTYISPKIPKKLTNVLYMLVTGIESVFNQIEFQLKTFRRERNILTATEVSSLRNLSAQNGFEPTLKMPASGLLGIKAEAKLFGRVGFPLYLLPYSKFICKENSMLYYYDSNSTLKITNDIEYINLVQGNIMTKKFNATGVEDIERFYIDSNDIVNGSIMVTVNNNDFMEVKSFFDKINENDNKQFQVKHSTNIDNPIVIYIKGLQLNDTIIITYRVCAGEFGNIPAGYTFICDSIINSNGDFVSIADDEATIQNITSFDFGSNGTTVNALKSAIGFNHGINLLFDNTSYLNFLNKYSSIITQKILIDDKKKSINNIYVLNKNYIPLTISDNALVTEYQSIINNKRYLLSKTSKSNLEDIISKQEFALSSHNIHDGEINKFAFQISYQNIIQQKLHDKKLEILLYTEFSKFLFDKNHQVNIELIFNDYQKANNIEFEFMIFNNDVESKKLIDPELSIDTPTIITHQNKLPIIRGDFDICGHDGLPYKLFFDVNNVVKI